jgi:molybdopterin converting factor small subunit
MRTAGGLGRILVDEGGALRPTLLVFLGDEQVAGDDEGELADGDTLTIMTPVSGG